MSAPDDTPRRRLPARPSREHLRKQAKRLAKSDAIPLAAAQRRLAGDYGYRNWAALMHAVDETAGTARSPLSPLSEAAARADEAEVRRLLAEGQDVEGLPAETRNPLWHVCAADAPAGRRIAVARLLLEAGASPRLADNDNATALHAAAQRGPLALVELLIRHGGLTWQADRRGKTALDYARTGSAGDRDAIVELLDRPVLRDPRFRAAVAAIHAGDLDGLIRLLDAHPALLRERAVEPDCYPQDYFRDPKLFWFVANNPSLMRKVPANIVEIARAMITRGVSREDLDCTLELVMSAGTEHTGGHNLALMRLMLDAGATVTANAVIVTLAHWVLEPVEALLDRGMAMTAPIAAALGREPELARLLPDATPEDRQTALGLAVINRRLEAARLCLAAGADAGALLPVHKHSTPLHQAAVNDDLPMLKLLVAHGARLDVRDTLWDATPLHWAVHNSRSGAEAYLRSLQQGAG